ncbi:MAG: PKD domain-containing protein [Bacteroidota bacterium]
MSTSQAQKEDYIWMLGRGNAFDPLYTTSILDFKQYPPRMEIYFQDFDFNIAASIISDNEGQLLCYSNGIDIKNSNHEIIENGGELLDYMYFAGGLTTPQGSLILPIPESNNRCIHLGSDVFYFRPPGQSITSRVAPLYLSEIDMNGNDGSGLVTLRNEELNTDTLSSGQFTATRHGNGRDWWIIIGEYGSNSYYRYLLSPTGVEEQGKQITGDTVIEDLGQAVFSPDGRFYVRYNGNGITNQSYIDLYDFDRCTGLLSNHQPHAIDRGLPGGVAFSPNSRYLYISLWEEIWQYDLQAPNVFDSGVLVAEYDGFLGNNQGLLYHNRFFMMQLAPDGRIYINIPNVNSQYLHVIQYPDRPGLACEVRQHHIQLPAFNAFTLPNLPNYRLGPEQGSPCDTLGLSSPPWARFRFDRDTLDSLLIHFTDLSAYTPTDWSWDFGDGQGRSDEQHPPYYRFVDNGRYEVCLTVSNALGSDTQCQTLYLGIPTSITEISSLSTKVFPNPFSDYFYLKSTRVEEGAIVQIHDILGRLVDEQRIDGAQQRIEAGGWVAGLYFYQIIKSNQVLAKGRLLKSQ